MVLPLLLVDETEAPPPAPLVYQQQAVAHWEGYGSKRSKRRFSEHEELLRSYHGHWKLKEAKGRRFPRRERRFTRKRIESAQVHELFAIWLAINHQAEGLEVGRWQGEGVPPRPLRLQEIADELGKLAKEIHGVDAVVSVTAVKDARRRFRANGWLHWWQEREFDPDNKERPFRGKVPRLWVTKEFLRASRAGGLHRQLLEKRRNRARTKAQRIERANLREFTDSIAGRLSEGLWVKFEREVMGEHPDWALDRDRCFKKIHEAIEAKLAEWRRRRPPPT